tara:strand:+ start:183 stop:356 length:174 start_codon:yes stop_codon:yes gene_type:complete
MLEGMLITNGLNGLKDIFCSSNKLNKKVNIEGAYCVFKVSTCAGVINIKKERMNISE